MVYHWQTLDKPNIIDRLRTTLFKTARPVFYFARQDQKDQEQFELKVSNYSIQHLVYPNLEYPVGSNMYNQV